MASSQGRACDLNSVISCSAVLDSPFAKIFGVPVAALGVSWYLILVSMAYLLVSSSPVVPELVLLALAWCATGCVFVVYLLLVELHLGAVCPVCTVIHLLTIVHTVCAYRVLRRLLVEKSPHMRFADLVQASLLAAKPWLVRAAVAFIVPAVYFTVVQGIVSGQELELASALGVAASPSAELADAADPSLSRAPRPSPLSHAEQVQLLIACLEHRHVRFFGQSTCSHCRHQKELFLPVVLPPSVYYECLTLVKQPDGAKPLHVINDECKRLGLHKFPSWLQFDSPGLAGNVTQQHSGVAQLVALAQRYNCSHAFDDDDAPPPPTTLAPGPTNSVAHRLHHAEPIVQ